ncbi:MAG TPA: ABC transporter substrate-binding protein [Candidatus Sulfomarinibacteraceae bacterium]|nr:ABC transporter substrate-binding protein [Candidatus Sulfomarinibacteraceae bacterium]
MSTAVPCWGRLAAALPQYGAWFDELAHIVEQGRAAHRELAQAMVHEQYAAVLRILAARRPLLLILEDLHWADADTLALLFHLGQQVTPAPLLLIGTYRPEEVQTPQPSGRPLLEKIVAEFKRTYGAAVVDLDAISAAEGRAFVDGLLRAEQLELDDRFRDALLRHTGGQPLFTIELLYDLRARGDLQAAEDGGWQVGAVIDWTKLPGKGEVQRSYLHETIGNALEQLYRGETETIAARLAWHFGEENLADKILHYSLLAGDQARLEYTFTDAASHYENAIAILQEYDDPAPAARTLMKLGMSYHLGLDYRRARRAFNEGFAVWQQTERRAAVKDRAEAPHAFRQSSQLEPKTLDHLAATNVLENDIVRQLFTGLTESRDGVEILPGAAARWELATGGCTYIFHLRHDARWSDGCPVTAGDFVLAVRQALDPQNVYYESKLDDIKGAAAYRQGEAPAEQLGIRELDRHTLLIELERPSSRFLPEGIFPVPSHTVQRYGEAWAEAGNLISNGPFRLVKWQPQERLIFERNPFYHGRFEGNVSRVELQIRHSWTTALAAYERGELDVLSTSDAPVEAFQLARQRHLSDYISVPLLKTYFLAFNVNREPFRDRRVRQALALAIDRELLADMTLQGTLFPATGGMIPQGVAGHVPGLNPPYDPQQARALLAEAGFPDGRHFPTVVA